MLHSSSLWLITSISQSIFFMYTCNSLCPVCLQSSRVVTLLKAVAAEKEEVGGGEGDEREEDI